MNLSKLNFQQKKAAESIGSPILIFAGAGSGKTRVLTYKIAWLIKKGGLPPEHILAVTFTNKAANEMRERINKLIPDIPIGMINMGTFHSICARILRCEINQLGFTPGFTIYDQTDSRSLVKNVIKNLNLDSKQYHPNGVQNYISKLKNDMIMPEMFQSQAHGYWEEAVTEIYHTYQSELKKNNALDFDDLILHALTLFKNYPTVLNEYRHQYQYVLVDEYQDTNVPQFQFIKYLSMGKSDICVVGDDDQSIYGWRGADINNILNFEKVFPGAKVFKLEQNYRSTQIILDAAHAVVKQNKNRAEKKLWTENKGGEKVTLLECMDERHEAKQIVTTIQIRYKENYKFGEIVILYRTNAQSRSIEDELRKQAIPYKIVGGVKFYNRKEVKDVLAYLRLIVNPKDDLSLERIINFPPRGIGLKTIASLKEQAIAKKVSLLDLLSGEFSSGRKQSLTLNAFSELISKLMNRVEKHSPHEIIHELLTEIHLESYYSDQKSEEAIERWTNVEELVATLAEFTELNPANNLDQFLEEVSLLTDIDRWNDEASAVTLMTLHTAKGLEFPVVLICGMEEGLFPLYGSLDDEQELAEERRLFYVGLTRAEQKVYLTFANSRRRFGGLPVTTQPSRFVYEIPAHLIEDKLSQPKTKWMNSGAGTIGDFSPVNQSSVDYSVGSRVRHKLFGTGTIQIVDGLGDDAKLTIRFDGNQVKKLIRRYANLTLV